MIDSFDSRNSQFGIRIVRHSTFVIRGCPTQHASTGRSDFVLANPPFNGEAVTGRNSLLSLRGSFQRLPVDASNYD